MESIMRERRAGNWVRISLFNLLVVSLFGLLMRYKIVFSLPGLNQKFLLHAHSHFAFGGWVSLLLMVLMVRALPASVPGKYARHFHRLLIAWLVCAYGMLVTFTLQGYAFASILFSTAAVVLSFVFAISYFRALKAVPGLAGARWLKAALVWNMLSAIGTSCLSLLMATHTANQEAYLASIYWYLHFQYNGWFFFACMGLFIRYLHARNIALPGEKMVFGLFLWSCLPAYGLSVLWLKLPAAAIAIAGMSAVAQALGWSLLLRGIFRSMRQLLPQLSKLSAMMLSVAGLAFTVKIILQLASADPSLSAIAFGSRTIVITYLHLVLLVGISLFLMGLVVAEGLLPVSRYVQAGAVAFTAGVVLNELLLAAQSIGGLLYFPLPGIFESLLGVSVLMSAGLGMMNAGWTRVARLQALPVHAGKQ
ncbi:hypothetical protein [Chitinophaga caseinilytica]|uniref:Uncharacterized protein n=1 Tax=Chitinophaga caseinilytica TaxID=2267521 RepID=A0ABZ2Z033_9BACT